MCDGDPARIHGGNCDCQFGLAATGVGGGVLTPCNGLMPAGRVKMFSSGGTARPAGFTTGTGWRNGSGTAALTAEKRVGT